MECKTITVETGVVETYDLLLVEGRDIDTGESLDATVEIDGERYTMPPDRELTLEEGEHSLKAIVPSGWSFYSWGLRTGNAKIDDRSSSSTTFNLTGADTIGPYFRT